MSEEIKKEAQDVELNPEELGGVAGGLIVDVGNFDSYRIVDDTTGEVLYRRYRRRDAERYAFEHKVSMEIINPEEYKKRFGKELDMSAAGKNR